MSGSDLTIGCNYTGTAGVRYVFCNIADVVLHQRTLNVHFGSHVVPGTTRFFFWHAMYV